MSRPRESRTAKKVPRSYRAGNLLTLLDSDLPAHRLERQSVDRGRFIPEAPGLAGFEVHERVIRNFLGHIAVAVFSHRLTGPGRGLVRVDVTGKLRPTGIEPTVVEGDDEARLIASGLGDDGQFLDAALALDFKRFEVIGDGRGWVAEVELMGASQVVTAIPPMRRYIRLYPDQRNALLGAFRAMDRVLGRT